MLIVSSSKPTHPRKKKGILKHQSNHDVSKLEPFKNPDEAAEQENKTSIKDYENLIGTPSVDMHEVPFETRSGQFVHEDTENRPSSKRVKNLNR